jgi:hypothetical protein
MTQTGPASSPPDDTDTLRWKYGTIVVALGLAAILGAVLIVLWRDPSGAGSIVGVVSGPIAAIIGAYFGVQVSSSAAKDAQKRAAKAEDDKANALADRATALGALDPQKVEELRPRLHFQPGA